MLYRSGLRKLGTTARLAGSLPGRFTRLRRSLQTSWFGRSNTARLGLQKACTTLSKWAREIPTIQRQRLSMTLRQALQEQHYLALAPCLRSMGFFEQPALAMTRRRSSRKTRSARRIFLFSSATRISLSTVLRLTVQDCLPVRRSGRRCRMRKTATSLFLWKTFWTH